MKQPIGFTFNGALQCPCCTDAAVESGELLRPDNSKPLRCSVYKFRNRQVVRIADDLVNTNGEEVGAAFAIGYPDGYTCDTCGEVHP
jgi:hypothetical protein